MVFKITCPPQGRGDASHFAMKADCTCGEKDWSCTQHSANETSALHAMSQDRSLVAGTQ
jgi:hypothetical protein